jgi:hypothetical protein
VDKYNTFHTRTTYALVRLDWGVIMVISFVLLMMNWREVHWWRFTWAFLLPDVIATFPGLYLYYSKPSGTARSIPLSIHFLYNVGHSFAGVAVLCGLWWMLTGRLEWAMLAFPIHLGGDRSLFGNIYKPFGTAFEPVKHEAYEKFEKDYASSGNWGQDRSPASLSWQSPSIEHKRTEPSA